MSKKKFKGRKCCLACAGEWLGDERLEKLKKQLAIVRQKSDNAVLAIEKFYNRYNNGDIIDLDKLGKAHDAAMK